MATRGEAPQDVVARGYDAVAERYAALEGAVAWPRMRWLQGVLAQIPPGSRVLDLGCGNGVPATREIAREHEAVGVDVSARQIELAREAVPGATFVCADVLGVDLPEHAFDAVVAFYLLDHVPRERHAELLERIRGWLRPGGIFLATVEVDDEPGVTGEWLGVPMYFSSFDADTSRRLIRESGFDLLADEVEVQLEGAREVPYLWIVARSGTGEQEGAR